MDVFLSSGSTADTLKWEISPSRGNWDYSALYHHPHWLFLRYLIQNNQYAKEAYMGTVYTGPQNSL